MASTYDAVRAQENQNSNISNACNTSNLIRTDVRGVTDDDGLEVCAISLYRRLIERGFALSVEGERLRWRGPAGVLIDEERDAIRAHKAVLLGLLSGFSVRAAFNATKARLHALTIDERHEGQGVRGHLLEYAARAELAGSN